MRPGARKNTDCTNPIGGFSIRKQRKHMVDASVHATVFILRRGCLLTLLGPAQWANYFHFLAGRGLATQRPA